MLGITGWHKESEDDDACFISKLKKIYVQVVLRSPWPPKGFLDPPDGPSP